MRVGLVIYGSLDTLSGGYLYDRKLVDYLRGQGDTVEVISLPWRRYAAHLVDNFSVSLARRLARLDLDVLLEDELNHPSLFGINERLAGQVRYPIVSIVHHLRSCEMHPPLAQALYRRVEQRFLRSVNGFVFNSRTTQQAVQELLGRPVNGVVASPGGDQFGERLSEAAVRLRAGRAGPLRILFVGNLIARKGLHTLLAALSRLPSPGWLLHVVGREDVDPAYTARVKSLVRARGMSERVIFLDRLPADRLRDEWKRCSVLVVPSQYEGFGIVYLEAMAYGVPSIASTAGAAGELITDGVNGLLVPPDDPEALANRLGALIEDRTLLADLSVAARRRFDDFPTWQESAGRIRAYLRSCISTQP